MIQPVRNPDAWPVDQTLWRFLEHPERYFNAKAEWDAAAEKRYWGLLMAGLRQQGFSLTEALVDLEKNGSDQSHDNFLYQRRLKRDDAFCCQSGQKLELDLREAE